jgi:hypothetical protein
MRRVRRRRTRGVRSLRWSLRWAGAKDLIRGGRDIEEMAHPAAGVFLEKIPVPMFSISLLQPLGCLFKPRLALGIEVLKKTPADIPLHHEEHTQESKARGCEDSEKKPVCDAESHHGTQLLYTAAP